MWSWEGLGEGIGQLKPWDEEAVRAVFGPVAKSHCQGTREEGCVWNITKIMEALDLHCSVVDTLLLKGNFRIKWFVSNFH
jgi:hypothetical protein